MSPTRHNASQAADQPLHEALKEVEVELACMDLRAVVNSARPEKSELRLSAVNLRGAAMDAYGVGYTVEIADGKFWRKITLSRRNFGIDNFCLDMSTTQYVRASASVPETGAGLNIQMTARVWHWKGDEVLARQAILDVMGAALKNQVEAFKEIEAKAAAQLLDADPLPASKPRRRP